MASAKTKPGISNPLQLFGLYLAWAESAMATSLFATMGVEHWSRHFLIVMMGLGLLAYVGVAGFLLIYLVIKKPGFLFNPSDYAPGVQAMLFDQGGSRLIIANPPIAPEQGGPPPAG